jgi:hypothetical protein
MQYFFQDCLPVSCSYLFFEKIGNGMTKAHVIFEKKLENGETEVFGIDDAGQAYWNDKPLITEKRVILPQWLTAAIILLAVAALAQAVFAGLSWAETRRANAIKAVPAPVMSYCLEFKTPEDLKRFNSTGVIPAGAKISSKSAIECRGVFLPGK